MSAVHIRGINLENEDKGITEKNGANFNFTFNQVNQFNELKKEEDFTKKNDNIFNFTFNQVIRFNELNKEANFTYINTIKNLSIFIFFIFVLITSWYFGENGFSNYNFEKLQQKFPYDNIKADDVEFFLLYSIISIILVSLLSLFSHYLVYRKLGYKNSFGFDFKYILSPDLYFAKFYKKKIKDNCKENKTLTPDLYKGELFEDIDNINTIQWNKIKIETKFFVENSNWINIFLTIIGIFILYLINNFLYEMIEFSLTLVIFRLISRGIEITYAFYKDIVTVDSKLFILNKNNYLKSFYFNGFKASLIRQSGRLSLAIHTLLEFTILYAFIYYLFFNIISNTIDSPTLFEMLLFSSSLGLFNISFNAYPNILLAVFHSSQIILSGVLILLSIAQYIGADKTLTKEEEVFYRYSELLANKNYKEKIIEYFKEKEDRFLPLDHINLKENVPD